MKFNFVIYILLLSTTFYQSQYQPKNISESEIRKAETWVNTTYNSLSQDEKIGQLFIVALYTNKGEDFINKVRNIVTNDKIGD